MARLSDTLALISRNLVRGLGIRRSKSKTVLSNSIPAISQLDREFGFESSPSSRDK
jgi:hypothetical protein